MNHLGNRKAGVADWRVAIYCDWCRCESARNELERQLKNERVAGEQLKRPWFYTILTAFHLLRNFSGLTHESRWTPSVSAYMSQHTTVTGERRERKTSSAYRQHCVFLDKRRPFGEVVRSGTRRSPSCDKVQRIESEKTQ